MNDYDYKSLYEGIEPSPWAVGRLRSRIEAMRTDPFDDILAVFRQRIAAVLAIAMVLIGVLSLRGGDTDSAFASEWNDYLGTSGVEQLATDLPDYIQTLD